MEAIQQIAKSFNMRTMQLVHNVLWDRVKNTFDQDLPVEDLAMGLHQVAFTIEDDELVLLCKEWARNQRQT